jgi:hypothetical protein
VAFVRDFPGDLALTLQQMLWVRQNWLNFAPDDVNDAGVMPK